MNLESKRASFATSPIGRGRIASAALALSGAIRVRGSGLSLRCNPLTPTLSLRERERDPLAATLP
jgi:hypothetical protein